ncbi:MAG: hypothetical protein AAFR04_02545 [Pseudomonadota bacterium]
MPRGSSPLPDFQLKFAPDVGVPHGRPRRPAASFDGTALLPPLNQALPGLTRPPPLTAQDEDEDTSLEAKSLEATSDASTEAPLRDVPLTPEDLEQDRRRLEAHIANTPMPGERPGVDYSNLDADDVPPLPRTLTDPTRARAGEHGSLMARLDRKSSRGAQASHAGQQAPTPNASHFKVMASYIKAVEAAQPAEAGSASAALTPTARAARPGSRQLARSFASGMMGASVAGASFLGALALLVTLYLNPSVLRAQPENASGAPQRTGEPGRIANWHRRVVTAALHQPTVVAEPDQQAPAPRPTSRRATAPLATPAQPGFDDEGPRFVLDLHLNRITRANARFPLRLINEDLSDPLGMVLIHQLPTGTRFSKGQRFKPNSWAINPVDLPGLRIMLPATAPDSFDLRIELIDADGAIATRVTTRVLTAAAGLTAQRTTRGGTVLAGTLPDDIETTALFAPKPRLTRARLMPLPPAANPQRAARAARLATPPSPQAGVRPSVEPALEPTAAVTSPPAVLAPRKPVNARPRQRARIRPSTPAKPKVRKRRRRSALGAPRPRVSTPQAARRSPVKPAAAKPPRTTPPRTAPKARPTPKSRAPRIRRKRRSNSPPAWAKFDELGGR